MGRWAPYRLCRSCGSATLATAPSADPHWTTDVEPSSDQEAFWSGREAQWSAAIGDRGTGRLVDVGCGFGHFVAWASARGWDAWGVDDDVWAQQRSKAPGRTVPTLADLEGQFDVATLWDVLEHVERPAAFLAELADRVRPGGRIFVGVPNFAALRLRWPLLRLDGRRFSDVVRPDEHVVQFTGKGLTLTLERAGLRDVELVDVPLSRSAPPVAAEVIRRVPALRRGIFAVGHRA